jgi:hypothetical protein
MVLKGFGFAAFFASVEASSICIHLSCLVCFQSVAHGVWRKPFPLWLFDSVTAQTEILCGLCAFRHSNQNTNSYTIYRCFLSIGMRNAFDIFLWEPNEIPWESYSGDISGLRVKLDKGVFVKISRKMWSRLLMKSRQCPSLNT